MFILKLAIRNILGAGLRTWLNVAALSFSFVAIIFLQGFYQGLNDQVERSTVDALYGGGQYWDRLYNPFDPLSLDEAHGVLPPSLQSEIAGQRATAILIRPATIYPHGRFRSILLKGIDPGQKILSLPSGELAYTTGPLPGLIGTRMASGTGLRAGDAITVQWRDRHGTFDAREVRIAGIFRTPVQETDNDQIWIPIEQLRRMTGLAGEATMVVAAKGAAPVAGGGEWQFRDLRYLLQDLRALVRVKNIQGAIMYSILMLLAMLAIFDTQVLSVWRRRKEIGTLMALGMRRGAVIALFTTEGAMHGAFAAVAAAAYGVPLFAYAATRGFHLPPAADGFGIAMGEQLFPVYTPLLVAGTVALVCTVTTIVSYLPARTIATLSPTAALRGNAG